MARWLKLKKKDVVFSVRDWKGRTVVLTRGALLGHVLRLHIDSAFVVDAIKNNLASPRVVVDNPGGKSEVAIYDIPNGGHPCLPVAIKYRIWPRENLIASFYGITEDHAQETIRKSRVLWPKK